MLEIDLRLMRYFATVGRHLHFGRGSDELFISQPALSQAIAKLEKQLDVRLFDRDRRRVELTPAGQQLLPEAEDLIARAEAAISVGENRVRREHRPSTSASSPHPASRCRRSSSVPRSRTPTSRSRHVVSSGRTRRAPSCPDRSTSASPWAPIDDPALDHITVASEGRVVGFSSTHRLAGRTEVRVTDILHERIVTSSHCPSEAWRLWWAAADERDGVPINWGPEVDTVEDLFEQVALGHAIMITARLLLIRIRTHRSDSLPRSTHQRRRSNSVVTRTSSCRWSVDSWNRRGTYSPSPRMTDDHRNAATSALTQCRWSGIPRLERPRSRDDIFGTWRPDSAAPAEERRRPGTAMFPGLPDGGGGRI